MCELNDEIMKIVQGNSYRKLHMKKLSMNSPVVKRKQ
jgi:hypothetical protein